MVQAFRLPFHVQSVRDATGLTHTVVFGQVRPRAGPHHVVIERRTGVGRSVVEASLGLLGSGIVGPACNDFATDADGFFSRTLPYRPGSLYRAAWTRGDRIVRFSQGWRRAARRVVGQVTDLARPAG